MTEDWWLSVDEIAAYLGVKRDTIYKWRWQASGQANGRRALIKAEQQRGPEILRLANALSALYPTGSEEKGLLDAMLLAVPR